MTGILVESPTAARAIEAASRATSTQLQSAEAQTTHAWIALAQELLGGRLPGWTGSALPGIDVLALEAARIALRDEVVDSQVTAGDIAAAFERHLARGDSGALQDRRNTGSYFTPPHLIDLVVERTLTPLIEQATTLEDVLKVRIFDPAVGAGGFLLSSGRVLTDRIEQLSKGLTIGNEARQMVVEHCLYGADANPLAVLLTSAILRWFAGKGEGPGCHLQWADSILPHSLVPVGGMGAPPLDTSGWFEEPANGFDAIVGNPPWGAVKPAIREFFALADPSVLQWQGVELRDRIDLTSEHADRWSDHAAEVRSYAKALRESGGYAHQGRGDADLYRYFTERSYQLLRWDTGRLGLLVPAAFLRSDGATPLRRLLLESGSFEAVVEFINSSRIFEIHSMFRFAMLIWQRGAPRGIDHARFGVRTVDEARDALEDSPTTMPLPFLSRVSGERLTVPDVRSLREATLLERLYTMHPTLGEEGCAWHVRFVRELDMTNDSRHFVHTSDVTDSSDLVPLYEGRMVHQFDSRAKRYESGAGRKAAWCPQELGDRRLAPHFFVPNEVALDAGAGLDRAGFCDITGHANERTILAALIPGNAVAGNKVPTVRFDGPNSRDLHLIWLALANSFVIDWIARRRVATSLNFFQLAQLPFPRVEPASEMGKQMVDLVSTLSHQVDEWTLSRLSERSRARTILDVLVAQCFEFDLCELAFLFSDFPLLDRHAPPAGRTRRSTVTRDVILHSYAASLGATDVRLADVGLPEDGGPSELAERVATAEREGQIAYIPGENAKRIWTRRESALL